MNVVSGLKFRTTVKTQCTLKERVELVRFGVKRIKEYPFNMELFRLLSTVESTRHDPPCRLIPFGLKGMTSTTNSELYPTSLRGRTPRYSVTSPFGIRMDPFPQDPSSLSVTFSYLRPHTDRINSLYKLLRLHFYYHRPSSNPSITYWSSSA